MRIRTMGLAALMAGSLMGNGMAQSVDEEIQNDEDPGSEIGVEIGPGSVEIGRERNLNPSPVEIQARHPPHPEALFFLLFLFSFRNRRIRTHFGACAAFNAGVGNFIIPVIFNY